MEDEVDEKICVSTYECSGISKIHSYITCKSLDDLKTQLKAEGYTSVGLIKFGFYDESENRIKSGIKIDDLSFSHVKWCIEKTSEDRYLALYSH
jgi:hypothetical protein